MTMKISSFLLDSSDGVLRRLALSMLKNAPGLKGSIDSRRKQAGWDEATLENALFGRQASES